MSTVLPEPLPEPHAAANKMMAAAVGSIRPRHHAFDMFVRTMTSENIGNATNQHRTLRRFGLGC
jgi:hypothetical protein